MDCLAGLCGCCFSQRNIETNPIMDAEAKKRAAEAAEQRYAKFESSAHGKAAKRSDQALAAERQRSREGRGGPDLVAGWREGS